MAWIDLIIAELEEALANAEAEAASGVPREALDAWNDCW